MGQFDVASLFLGCRRKFETPEEIKTDMGIRHDEKRDPVAMR